MSDPVTNVEIEDVLSSIRRLVSEGEKARRSPEIEDTAPEPSPPSPDQQDNLTDKLLLTPALRVAAPQEDETPAVPQEAPDNDTSLPQAEAEPEAATSADPSTPTDRASLEATIAELEAAVVKQDDEWEPDGSEVVGKTPHALGLVITDDTEDAIAPDDSGDLIVGDTDEDEADAGPRADDEAESNQLIFKDTAVTLPRDLDQRMVDFDVKSDQVGDTAKAEIDDAASKDALDNLAAAVTEAAIRDTADDVMLTLVPDAPWPPEKPAEEDETDLIADVADLLDVEDAAEEPSLTEAMIAFRHLASPDASDGQNLTGQPGVDEDETLEAFLARGGGVDEEALRIMVMDIVRSELQGPLGERITRNVRKLVRREIMRVLNAQDMD